MNSEKLKNARAGIRGNAPRYSASQMALMIGCSTDSYRKKERGLVGFSVTEMKIICNALDLSVQEFSDTFFDGKLEFSDYPPAQPNPMSNF